jgi:adenylyl-sulfate kinase
MVKKSGFTIWFTGLSGSGKSTLANLVSHKLRELAIANVEVLDGDVVRTHLSKGLGYSKEDRDTNIRRIGWVCQLLTKHGIPNIAAAIEPYREVRQEVRRMVQAAGGPGSFIEVYVNCPIDVCEKRDRKGLYKKARLGQISNFTGIADPYEPPEAPEVVLDTAKESAEESMQKGITTLRMLGWVEFR